MKKKLLAVTPLSTNYLHIYDVEVAHSFEEAKAMIEAAEMRGEPYADLDLPVYDEKCFWEFVGWMEQTHRNYRFSIFGVQDEHRFWAIAQKVREKGFHFNS